MILKVHPIYQVSINSKSKIKMQGRNSYNNSILLTSLTADIHIFITSFLKTKDALEYSKACKVIHSALGFRMIQNVNTIQYQQFNINRSSACLLCKEIIPSLKGRQAVHSYRIRCTYKEGFCEGLTFVIKNLHEEFIAMFIVDADHRNIVMKPSDGSQSHFLCHYQEDEEVDMNFDVDILVHNVEENIGDTKGKRMSAILSPLSPKSPLLTCR